MTVPLTDQHVMTVDLEDYFHAEAFADIVACSQWDAFPSRVEFNTQRVLDLLDEYQVSATFFILGWVAARFPTLVREIVARGHEPACHSYKHRLIFALSPDQFRQDTAQAKEIIEQATGRPIYGYRAPTFSVTRQSLWALDILAELGFRYDSSIFPVHHDVYGMPRAPRFPFRVETPSGPLLEYPMPTMRLPTGHRLPVGGGGYLRLLPFWYTRLGLRAACRERRPFIVYVHSWELDTDQPRIAGRLRSRLRHYANLEKTETRLRRLLQQPSFSSFAAYSRADTARDVNLQAWLSGATPAR